MKVIIRKLKASEYILLEDFLYEAIYIPNGVQPPDRNIIQLPELQVYIQDFGKLKDDYALVAEIDGQIVGAIWARIMNDYGHIDNYTPSLAIAIYKPYRGFKIGTRLLKKMLLLLKDRGYKYVSLAVQKDNYAVHMYQQAGFETVDENQEEYIMKCKL